jgi:superfamily I DNA and/or RNA helicase
MWNTFTCQGREKDVAIFSCVRSNDDRRIGFVSDARRMNVGITRAKSAVLVGYLSDIVVLLFQGMYW